MFLYIFMVIGPFTFTPFRLRKGFVGRLFLDSEGNLRVSQSKAHFSVSLNFYRKHDFFMVIMHCRNNHNLFNYFPLCTSL